MRTFTKKLSCSDKVFETITKDCVKEYIAHHPEMTAVHITQEKILFELARFYLTTNPSGRVRFKLKK